MTLRGQLADLGLAEILHVVGAARRSGILRLHAPSGETRVAFRAGTVAGVRHAGMPTSDEELASASGFPAESPAAQAWLAQRIEALMRDLVKQTDGAFEFELVDPDEWPAHASAMVLLAHGVPHARLLAAHRGPEDRRLKAGAPPRSPAGPPSPVAAATRPESSAPEQEAGALRVGSDRRHVLLVAVESGTLRRSLARLAGAAGWEVRELASSEEADLALETSLRQGAAVALIARASGAALAGVELVAAARGRDRLSTCALLATRQPADWALRARARELGADLIALTGDLGQAGQADAVASDLLERVRDDLRRADPPSGVAPAEPVRLEACDPEGASPWPIPSPDERTTVSLSDLTDACLAARHASECALAILEAASLRFEKGMLLIADAAGLLPHGAFGPQAEQLPASLSTGMAWPAGPDALSEAARSRRPFFGRLDSPADAELALFFGTAPSASVALLPFVHEGACVAVLQGDSGQTESTGLSELERFVREVGPAFGAALERSRARVRARQARWSA